MTRYCEKSTVEDYFSRSWDHGAPEPASPPPAVTQDPTQGYYYTVPPPSETQNNSSFVAEHGPTHLHHEDSYRLPIQHTRPISGPNPRKFHKRTRSGTKVMLASSSSVASTTSSKPKHRRKHRDGRSAQTSHHPSKKEVLPARPALTPRSRSNSSTLYRRPRGDQNDRIRRSKLTSSPVPDRVRSLVSPSLLTVLSTLTGTSSSSGSNVTVTPSTARSSRHSKRDSLTPRQRPSLSRHQSRELKEKLLSSGDFTASQVNVFDFLDHESPKYSRDDDRRPTTVRFVPTPTEAGAGSLPSETVHLIASSTAEPRAPRHKDSDAEPRYDGFMSDSGISVGDSPETRRVGNTNFPFTSFETVREPQSSSSRPESSEDIKNPAPYSIQDSSFPQAMATPNFIGTQLAQSSGYAQFLQPQPYHPPQLYDGHGYKGSNTPTEPTIAGYELLSSKLSAFPNTDSEDEPLVPLYRRFEQLHHRVLLHLQDEISELEEQLRNIDEYISRIQQEAEGSARPASRREDAQYSDTLRFQRTDTLGRICMKLEKYNQALESYRLMVEKTETVRQEDVTNYRDWVEKYQPVAKNEASFLDHGLDLTSISSRARQVRQRPRTTDDQSRNQNDPAAPAPDNEAEALRNSWDLERLLMLGPLAATMVMVIAFALLSNFWARLAMMLIFTSIGCAAMHLSQLRIDVSSREVLFGAGFYVAVMTLVAGRYSA